jgi:hypothetical protein
MFTFERKLVSNIDELFLDEMDSENELVGSRKEKKAEIDDDEMSEDEIEE